MSTFLCTEDYNENYKRFNKLLSEYNADKTLLDTLNFSGQFSDFQYLKEVKDGRLDIFFGNVKFSCFFKKNNLKKLYILLSGARTTDKNGIFIDQLPRFKRWSFYTVLDGSVLSVEDPMYYKHEKLRIGWFYGDDKISYIELLCQIVQEIAKKYKISIDDIIFYSSSAGGYAAVQASATISGSSCLAINPQLMLLNDYYKSRFEQLTSLNINKDLLLRNNTVKKIKMSKSKILIIQNLFDKLTMNEHLLPFGKAIGMNIEFEFNKLDNIIIFVYAAKGGHTAYKNNRMTSLLLKLFNTSHDDKIFHHQLTMLWYDYYNRK